MFIRTRTVQRRGLCTLVASLLVSSIHPGALQAQVSADPNNPGILDPTLTATTGVEVRIPHTDQSSGNGLLTMVGGVVAIEAQGAVSLTGHVITDVTSPNQAMGTALGMLEVAAVNEDQAAMTAAAEELNAILLGTTQGRIYDGFPMLNFNRGAFVSDHVPGEYKMKRLTDSGLTAPGMDGQPRKIWEVRVNMLWYDGQFDADTFLLRVPVDAHPMDTLRVHYRIYSLVSDDFAPTTLVTDTKLPGSASFPFKGFDSVWTKIGSDEVAEITVDHPPVRLLTGVYNWGWREHPPRIHFLQPIFEMTNAHTGQVQLEPKGEGFAFRNRQLTIDDIGAAAPEKKMYTVAQAVLAGASPAAVLAMLTNSATAPRGTWQDWADLAEDQTQLPPEALDVLAAEGIEQGQFGPYRFVTAYVNNEMYGEGPDGDRMEGWFQGDRFQVKVINLDNHTHYYRVVDFGPKLHDDIKVGPFSSGSHSFELFNFKPTYGAPKVAEMQWRAGWGFRPHFNVIRQDGTFPRESDNARLTPYTGGLGNVHCGYQYSVDSRQGDFRFDPPPFIIGTSAAPSPQRLTEVDGTAGLLIGQKTEGYGVGKMCSNADVPMGEFCPPINPLFNPYGALNFPPPPAMMGPPTELRFPPFLRNPSASGGDIIPTTTAWEPFLWINPNNGTLFIDPNNPDLGYWADLTYSYGTPIAPGGALNATIESPRAAGQIFYQFDYLFHDNAIFSPHPTFTGGVDPLFCACGAPQGDTDSDGTPDCVDSCSQDPNKTDPGFCGCGAPEDDTDFDGTPNCIDLCPQDPNKIASGFCGCGVSDDDTDFDGTLDCIDLCPQDPTKTEPGDVGCRSAVPAIGAINIGVIDRLGLDDPDDVWSGGVIVVGGQIIIVPRNMVMELPEKFLTLQQVFAQAPAECVALGESGLATHDECLHGGPGGVATILANRTSQGDVIAGDVFIEKGQELVSGRISYINHTDGYIRLNGRSGNNNTGVMVRVNDPDRRHTIQAGKGCAGGSNCSADPRFTNNPDNYTVVFSTGYPACLPSTVTGGQRSAGSDVNGTGDPFCPSTNRGVDPVPDSTRFAPMQVGDIVTAKGNFEEINGVRFLSAYDVLVQDALTTAEDPTQPDFMIFDEIEWDVAGFQNERIRLLLIGFSTHPGSLMDVFSLHVDPTTNENHEVPLASTVRNPLTTRQGIGFTNVGIFKIRYIIDFLRGAPVDPEDSACVNLLNAGLFVCSTVTNLAPEFNIVSPITRELIGRTRHKQTYPTLKVLDIAGNDAPWGEYLAPVGVAHPEFVEIDLNALQTPFMFSGVPWNLDRRLSPAGCIDSDGDGVVDCEATPQPLDPFPFSGRDPRTQALVPIQARDRILSAFGPGGPATSVLSWPPTDPPFIGAVANPVSITRATYKEEIGCTKIDVWAESDLSGDLVVSGDGLSPRTMVGDGSGRFFAHISLPVGVPVPSSVTVTQTTHGGSDRRILTDEVAVVRATFDVTTGQLSVAGSSSTASGSASLIIGTGEPTNANGEVAVAGIEVPPHTVRMASADGGSETRQVIVNPTPADVLTVAEAKYDSAQGIWTLTGTSSVSGPGNTVMAYLGPPVIGTLIGAGAVDAAGHWVITTAANTPADPSAPGAPTTISVQSTPLGGVLQGVTFNVE